MDYKLLIKEKGFSYSDLSAITKVPRATLNEVVNGKYKGSPETKERILSKIKVALSMGIDLNPVIYEHPKLMRKVFFNAVKSTRFDIKETDVISKVVHVLDEYLDTISKKEAEA
ncbi:MAG: helix-turn-helix transcriptional regulator [Nitrosarchaeum sp.]|nr:helix-turn-helix transcriptional regulator [Nitrosarchaeum sp.]